VDRSYTVGRAVSHRAPRASDRYFNPTWN